MGVFSFIRNRGAKVGTRRAFILDPSVVGEASFTAAPRARRCVHENAIAPDAFGRLVARCQSLPDRTEMVRTRARLRRSPRPTRSSSHTACRLQDYPQTVVLAAAIEPGKSATRPRVHRDTVQLRPRSRDVASPRKASVDSVRLRTQWCTWAATVVRPGPPAATPGRPQPPIVAKSRSPGMRREIVRAGRPRRFHEIGSASSPSRRAAYRHSPSLWFRTGHAATTFPEPQLSLSV